MSGNFSPGVSELYVSPTPGPNTKLAEVQLGQEYLHYWETARVTVACSYPHFPEVVAAEIASDVLAKYIDSKDPNSPNYHDISQYNPDSLMRLWANWAAIDRYRSNARQGDITTEYGGHAHSLDHTIFSEDAERPEFTISYSDGIEQRHDQPALAAPILPTETAAMNDLLGESLAVALSSIDPDRARALTMFEVGGYSYDEIAELADVAKGTVSSRIHRAKGQLAEQLMQEVSYGEAPAVTVFGSETATNCSAPELSPVHPIIQF